MCVVCEVCEVYVFSAHVDVCGWSRWFCGYCATAVGCGFVGWWESFDGYWFVARMGLG